jgi:hypothetical protein
MDLALDLTAEKEVWRLLKDLHNNIILDIALSERTNLSLNFRHNSETIKNNITVINNGNSINSIGVEKNEDLNATLQLAHKLNEQVKNTTRLYGTQFHSSQELTSDNGVPYLDVFKQQFARIENQTDIHLNKQLEFNIGGGYIHETANSTRYDNSTSIKTNRIGYALSSIGMEGVE